MNAELETELLSAFREAWKPKDKLEIYDWAAQAIKLRPPFAITGPFDVSFSNYLKGPFEALKNPNIKQVNCSAAAKTGKTMLGQIWLAHVITHAPGEFLWILQTDDVAALINETKTIPLLLNCPEVAVFLPTDRHKIRKDSIRFPHMGVTWTSAKESMLQSSDVRYVVGDECYLWKNTFIAQAKKRTLAHSYHSKHLFISTAGNEEDEWTKEFNKGIVYEWGWLCPSCNKEQPHRWSRLRPDGSYSGINTVKNKDTYQNGMWLFNEAIKTAALECHYCCHRVTDTGENREYLNRTGRYILTKPEGDPEIVSFAWPAWVDKNRKFSSLAAEYFQAIEAKNEGNWSMLREFYQKNLGQPMPEIDTGQGIKIPLEDGIVPTEGKTFLLVDVQRTGAKFRYVARTFTGKHSVGIAHGECNTWEEVDQLRVKYCGKNHQWVFVDSGDGPNTQDVYAQCLKHGHKGFVKGQEVWFSYIALKGFDQNGGWKHKDNIINPYSPLQYQTANVTDPALKGKRCPLYLWSNLIIKDMLFTAITKGTNWKKTEVDSEYEKQMNAEHRLEVLDKKTGKVKARWKLKVGQQGHYWDCEAMAIAAACIYGLYDVPLIEAVDNVTEAEGKV